MIKKIVKEHLQQSGLTINDSDLTKFLRISQLQKKSNNRWTTEYVGMKQKNNFLNTALLYFGLGLHLSKLNKNNFELYQRVLVETSNFNRIKTENLIQSIKNNNKEAIEEQFLGKTGIFSNL